MDYDGLTKEEAIAIVGEEAVEKALEENAEISGTLLDNPNIVLFEAKWETEEDEEGNYYIVIANYYQSLRDVEDEELELDMLDWEVHDFSIIEM